MRFQQTKEQVENRVSGLSPLVESSAFYARGGE
jgi:hypothetical protein